jgi:hypothetical protein
LSCSGVRLCLLRLAMALNIRIDEDFTFNVYEDINEDNFFNTNCLIKTETCPEETFDVVRFQSEDSEIINFAENLDIKTESCAP